MERMEGRLRVDINCGLKVNKVYRMVSRLQLISRARILRSVDHCRYFLSFILISASTPRPYFADEGSKSQSWSVSSSWSTGAHLAVSEQPTQSAMMRK
uniref:Uncharacterized protein n=1 Tax=Ditylenchus dipsaci TaxID=166011 RepID=A0A915DLP5_9BILA